MGSKDEKSIDALWGGSVQRVELDVTRHTLTLLINVRDGHEATDHMIRASGLAQLAFRSSIPSPWTYAEVTEAWMSERGNLTELRLLLWTEDASLTITAASIELE